MAGEGAIVREENIIDAPLAAPLPALLEELRLTASPGTARRRLVLSAQQRALIRLTT